jgi:hypothetical protein
MLIDLALEQSKIEILILIRKEDLEPAVSPLDQVMGAIRNNDPGDPGHELPPLII